MNSQKLVIFLSRCNSTAIATWVNPVLDSDSPASEDLLGTLIEVEPSIMEQMTTEATGTTKQAEKRLRLLLKASSALKSKNVPVENLETLLKAALTSSNEELRLLAFSVNCLSHKTTAYVSQETVANFLLFYECSKFCRESPIRQTLLATVRKFFKWVKESCAVSKRTDKNPGHAEYVTRMGKFLLDLLEVVSRDLIPGAHYSTEISGLSVVLLMEEQVGWISDVFSSEEAKSGLGAACEKLVPGLMWCLREPFDDVKLAALNVLKILPKNSVNFTDEYRKDMVDECLTTAEEETDAKVCLSAAFTLRAMVFRSAEEEKTRVLSLLAQALERNVQVAEKDLISAAASGPMFGTLMCARQLLEEIDTAADHGPVMGVLTEMLATSIRTSKAALPVSASESPEGFFPQITEVSFCIPLVACSRKP
jgi:hypothetical protein